MQEKARALCKDLREKQVSTQRLSCFPEEGKGAAEGWMEKKYRELTEALAPQNRNNYIG